MFEFINLLNIFSNPHSVKSIDVYKHSHKCFIQRPLASYTSARPFW